MNAPKRQLIGLSAVQPRKKGADMSIFNLTKEPPELSRDWKVFQQFIGNIGAFTYIAKNKTAYLDDVACRMLSCSGNKLNEFELPIRPDTTETESEEDIKERISHFVVMGIGEPFDNYDNVIKFIDIVNTGKGIDIGSRHITVSTCGIVPKIKEFMKTVSYFC